MPTIVVERGYAVVLNSRDHPPPHVHVRKGSKEARFAVGGNIIEPLSNAGFSRAELTAASRVVANNYELIVAALGGMSWASPRSKQRPKRRR